MSIARISAAALVASFLFAGCGSSPAEPEVGPDQPCNSFPDWQTIDHGDGTYAGYGHLQFNGVLVEVDQVVPQGRRIAMSGRSGTDTPHLHLHVSPCYDVDEGACRSLPVTFRNTRANPWGLTLGETYEALPY